MGKFEFLDYLILGCFFLTVFLIGYFSNRKKQISKEDFLISNRKVGLVLFILTNVSTWYGGILGISEFTYEYGLASWTTQGLPYYFFAIIFAFVFAKKIRTASVITIPEQLEKIFNKKIAISAAVLIFFLVNPAPYLLMIAIILKYLLEIDILLSLIISLIFTLIYLIKSGFSSDLYTDAFEFFIMFIGFIIALIFASNKFGGFNYLSKNLPETHLNLFGGASPFYIIVWFFIALWTFADPGFHQRCSAAKTKEIAFKGILISVVFWFLFDFLTNTFGLFSRAALPNLSNSSMAFLIFADEILPAGIKGLFYSALFATIFSTLNSFLFISGTTFGNDIISKIKGQNENRIIFFTRIGMIVAGIISVVLAYFIPSVINLWYLIGSVCIPSLLFLIIPAYYKKFRLTNFLTFVEIFLGFCSCILWIVIRYIFSDAKIIQIIEPMIFGLIVLIIFHFFSLIFVKRLINLN